MKMANYRSLIGGYFSSTPYDKSMKVSIRTNNPGAVNGAAWEMQMPGYVTTDETTPGNKTTIFETPEYGVAVWYELMRRYRDSTNSAKTVHDIIWRYGGGQANYEEYASQVEKWTGLTADTEIKLSGDDTTLLAFAKAMFRYEAGEPTPLSDKQILYGFNLARGVSTTADVTVPPPSIWTRLLRFILSFFQRSIVTAIPGDPAPHLTVMRKITGTQEVPGSGDNPFIVQEMTETIAKAYPDMATYARTYTHDSIPWCGQCLAYVVAKGGYRPVFGPSPTDKYLWAAAWAKEGPELIKLNPTKLFPGAIMVFTRDGGGHVSLYEGEDDNYYHIRGGNQSDAVNVERKAKSAFTAATWPRKLPIPPNAKPVRMDANHNPVGGSEA